MTPRRAATLLLIPSAYALFGWILSAILYLERIIPWDEPSERTLFFIAIAILSFFGSCCNELFRTEVAVGCVERRWPATQIEVAFHAIGLFGVLVYVRDLSRAMGGLDAFALALATTSYKIRWQAADTTSIGTQLSYFGWVAIGLTVMLRRESLRARVAAWSVVAIQIAANFLFIDRTRPIWILFVTCLVTITARGIPSRRQVVTLILGVPLLAGSAFLVVGQWIGKIPDEHAYGTSTISPSAQNAVIYMTSGFAYLNQLLTWPEPIDYSLDRTLSPTVNALATTGLVERAPSQVNEEYPVPFETNVGTVAEPFYRDGGMLYAILGLLIQSFGVDRVARWARRSKSPFRRYLWATLCFTSAVSFFTPKITTTPVWFVAVCAIALPAIDRRLLRRLSVPFTTANS